MKPREHLVPLLHLQKSKTSKLLAVLIKISFEIQSNLQWLWLILDNSVITLSHIKYSSNIAHQR